MSIINIPIYTAIMTEIKHNSWNSTFSSCILARSLSHTNQIDCGVVITKLSGRGVGILIGEWWEIDVRSVSGQVTCAGPGFLSWSWGDGGRGLEHGRVVEPQAPTVVPSHVWGVGGDRMCRVTTVWGHKRRQSVLRLFLFWNSLVWSIVWVCVCVVIVCVVHCTVFRCAIFGRGGWEVEWTRGDGGCRVDGQRRGSAVWQRHLVVPVQPPARVRAHHGFGVQGRPWVQCVVEVGSVQITAIWNRTKIITL